MKKKSVLKQATALTMALGICLSSSMTTFAGTWQQLEGGAFWQWKYVEDNGSYTTNNWQQIDGKWYHFDADGYLDVGMRKIDGKEYILLNSGELETNRDYGFASVDENGVFTLKNFNFWEAEEYINPYIEYCNQFGVDAQKLINDLHSNKEYVFSCSTVDFPKNSEGGILDRGVADCIIAAIDYKTGYWGNPMSPFRWTYNVNEETQTFTMTFSIVKEYDSEYIKGLLDS